MIVQEFGKQNKDVVILLHGGGLSWWNYRNAAAQLEERYRVVIPVLDGHAESDAPFTSIEENAARLIAYIDDRFGGQVLAIGGLSLGGQILVEMLSRRADICWYALIESALVKPMKLTGALIAPTFGVSYGLIKQKWFSEMQFAYLRIEKTLFDDYYRDTCKIGKTDMIAFMKANCTYSIKPALSGTKAGVLIVAGAKEQKNIRDSVELLCKAIPGSQKLLLKGFYHGELSINHPQQYAQMLEVLCRGEGR